MDHWCEEDEEVFVHPRDPYHRVNVLESSRHVRISVNGEVVAETDRPRTLFETGLPPRYYIAPADVQTCARVCSSRARRRHSVPTKVSLRITRSRPEEIRSMTSSGTIQSPSLRHRRSGTTFASSTRRSTSKSTARRRNAPRRSGLRSYQINRERDLSCAVLRAPSLTSSNSRSPCL
jgi:hypothetical protein